MTQYATLAQLKEYINTHDEPISDEDDDLLNLFLTNASATIDSQTQRHFEAEADTTRTHDAIADVEKGRTLWLNGDLAQLTSITNGDGSTILPSAVVTAPTYLTPFFALTLKRNSSVMWTYDGDPEGAIAVTGRWAYSVTPPDVIVQATLRLSNWYYKQRRTNLDLDRAIIVGNTTIAPSMIPADVMTLIHPYRAVVR